MGLSLTQIVILLAIVLPSGVVPSRATVGRWVQQSAAQSSCILRVLDRACQRWVLTLCLDEIFFHREPILMAVEPVSLAWLAGQRGPDRTGASWCEVVAKWPDLEHVIADGGTGLEKGVQLVNERLRQAVRASSAVEGVNSVVRMHQGRHRHVSQGMLDLKRLYWNCRVFREGKRKGRSPYDLLGLKLPTSDWWQLLQMDPEELGQKIVNSIS